MEKYTGKSVNQGIAAGKTKLFRKKKHPDRQDLERDPGQEHDPGEEIRRYEEAKNEAKRQLQELCRKAMESVGQEGAAIFEVHEMMLEDADFTDIVISRIQTDKESAESAVSAAGDHFSSVFSRMEDDYMRARADDIRDITERLLSGMQKDGEQELILDEPSIILAEDLTPGETVQLDRNKVLGFVTQKGSINSHTAILSRMMGIPALVHANISLTDDMDQKDAVLNGNSGELIISPDQAVLKIIEREKLEAEREEESLRSYIGRSSMTKDGREIGIFANIGDASDLPLVIENDADGIGLFRSEFLFLGRDTCPSEEEQFQTYKQAAETMAGKKVIIRTLDIGADKAVPYFNLEKEENPAMGYRAIRISLSNRELFKSQLRAIYRASVFGNLAVMYPMIISVEEIAQIKKINEEVIEELANEGLDYKEMEQGIMIETPASVMISDDLAKEVDFLSIGTNDLTQYTLAIDRQNDKLDAFFNPHHPAVLKMIRMVIENGHREGCWVGICGELGADPALTELFLEMGIDELSVSPPFVLPLRKTVCNF